MAELINFIQRSMRAQFTGYLQINFTRGIIAGVNRYEANMKLEELPEK